MNKEVTWLGKSQRNRIILQCKLSQENPFKAEHLNSLISNFSNSKNSTFIIHSKAPRPVKLSLLFSFWSKLKRKLILMRNHLHNPGTTSQRLSINLDLYSMLSNTLWCVNEELIVAVKRNLCNCVKKPEKNSGLQRGFNPWPHDTSAMLYQLSYEATDVRSRSIVGSYVPVKEMNVNDIWNKSYMNCGN